MFLLENERFYATLTGRKRGGWVEVDVVFKRHRRFFFQSLISVGAVWFHWDGRVFMSLSEKAAKWITLEELKDFVIQNLEPEGVSNFKLCASTMTFEKFEAAIANNGILSVLDAQTYTEI